MSRLDDFQKVVQGEGLDRRAFFDADSIRPMWGRVIDITVKY